MATEATLFPLRVRMFGESEHLMKINLARDQSHLFSHLANKLRMTVATALCDPYFYHKLGHRRIASAEDLNIETIYAGLRNTPKNQIEVWYAGRKVDKLHIDKLRNELLLFPLYNVKWYSAHRPDENGLFIIQREIGLVGNYEVQLQSFSIDKLEFKMTNRQGNLLLKGLQYDGKDFKLKRKDALQTFLQGYEIK